MNKNLRLWVRAALLLGVALAVQSLKLPAQITGIIINAVLFTAVALVHPLAGVAIGLATPWVAVAMGIMALVFMAPYVMLANLTLVVVYTLLKKTSQFVAVVAASLAKYAFFIVTINYLVPLAGKKLPAPALVVFGVQQLVTALAGGLLALIIVQTIAPIINRQA